MKKNAAEREREKHIGKKRLRTMQNDWIIQNTIEIPEGDMDNK